MSYTGIKERAVLSVIEKGERSG
uniref:Uncharacterized protein n=1 Tax=Anguilla anguilla TaxID=7936 RepID=A0A0E9XSD9_ANGAN